MTVKNNKKYVLCTLAGLTIIISVLYGISLNSANAAIQQQPVTELSFASNPGPEKYRTAGEPVLLSTVNVEQVTAKKGDTISVFVTLTHEAGNNHNAKITITPKINGFVIPNSVLTSTTMQERATMLANGDIPKGVIPLSDLVEFIPKSVVLNSGESKQLEMRITVPSTLPDEMIGDTLSFSPSYEISDKTGIDRIGIFTFNTDVKIQEQMNK